MIGDAALDRRLLFRGGHQDQETSRHGSIHFATPPSCSSPRTGLTFRGRGWKPAEICYLAEEGEKLGRSVPISGAFKALMIARALLATKAQREQMRRFAGYVLLEPC